MTLIIILLALLGALLLWAGLTNKSPAEVVAQWTGKSG